MVLRVSVLAFLAFSLSSSAKAADYVCVVTVPNAGDTVRDPSAGQPKHLFVGLQSDFLGRQSADEHAKDFLLHVHYYAGQGWEKDPYAGEGKAVVSTCVSFDDRKAAEAYLSQRYPIGFSNQSNAYVSETNFDGRPGELRSSGSL